MNAEINQHDDGHQEEHSLDTLESLTPDQRQVLQARWLNTVEAFVASAATDAGRKGLCEMLDLDHDDLQQVLDEAKSIIGHERMEELMKPRPGGSTGALMDEKQERQDNDVAPDDQETRDLGEEHS